MNKKQWLIIGIFLIIIGVLFLLPGKASIDNVFACGDVTNTKFKQAITGVAEGVTAAYNAYQYLESLE